MLWRVVQIRDTPNLPDMRVYTRKKIYQMFQKEDMNYGKNKNSYSK